MGTDPFEEFEFKPLTDGLGFHQKTPPTTTPPLKSRDLDFSDSPTAVNPFKSTLPRRDSNSSTSQTASTTAPISPVDDILNNLHKNRKMEIELDRQQRQELRNPKKTITWKASSPKVSPLLLDGMLITAASLLCMITMLIITRVDLVANLANPDTEGLIYLSTFCLFAGVAFIYMVIHRVFLGYTPGEWAYDLRLGTPEAQTTALYTAQVVARQLLVTVTGLALLPFLGFCVGKDLTGKIVGLSLFRKV